MPGFAQALLRRALLSTRYRKLNKLGYYLGQSLVDVALYNANDVSRANVTERTMYLDVKTEPIAE